MGQALFSRGRKSVHVTFENIKRTCGCFRNNLNVFNSLSLEFIHVTTLVFFVQCCLFFLLWEYLLRVFLSFVLSFFFLPHLWLEEIPGPGIQPAVQ